MSALISVTLPESQKKKTMSDYKTCRTSLKGAAAGIALAPLHPLGEVMSKVEETKKEKQTEVRNHMDDLSNLPIGTVVGDPLPGSPELSARGSVPTGSMRMSFIRRSVPDFRGGIKKPLPLSDRKLIFQAWYPVDADDPHMPIIYEDYMGRKDLDNLESYLFKGRAHLDGIPDPSAGKRPVVILSHGYPGSRMLLCNLAENLSSKGYVVLSIDHTDNTYADFIAECSKESALVHRTMDQRALLDELPVLNDSGPLKGLLDLDRIALIGFSMGGYGALRTLGAGISPAVAAQMLPIEAYVSEPDWHGDDRIKASVLFAPATFLIDAEHLEDITVPTMWLCGTMDRTVGYDAVHAAWKGAVNSRRTMISYIGCGHNVANNPAPPESLSRDWAIMKRWADPVWDTARLNTLNIHFITAFLNHTLLGQDSESYYANPSRDKELPGFVPETDAGIIVEHIPV